MTTKRQRLKVTAGPSFEQMVPITVNTSQPHAISSELFEGEMVAYIKGYTDDHGNPVENEYFTREDRQGITWSIQVQGRFLEGRSADDILFGNTFDHPLKVPWGTSAILQFMHFIDPTLDHDLLSRTKPWALSPLIATMPHFSHQRVSASGMEKSDVSLPAFPPLESLKEDTSHLHLAALGNAGSGHPLGSPRSTCSSTSINSDNGASASSPTSPTLSAFGSHSGSSLAIADADSPPTTASTGGRSSGGGSWWKAKPKRATHEESNRASLPSSFKNAAQRRSYFSSPENRHKLTFGPEDVITTDFCYGFISFNPSFCLQLPAGLSFDLSRYWDGQPVRFTCCERPGEGSKDPWGRIFWCVSVELVDIIDDEESDISD